MKVVQLNNIEKNFGQLPVLKGLDLALGQGEVLGLFGHNGAGKTTTMKIILGLLEPNAGEVKVFGKNPYEANFNHYRYQLGFLPENVTFYHQLTGLEVLNFFAKLKKVPINQSIELLKQVGLYEASSRKVKTYSKGMKQRLGLAQALLSQPSLLLLDEPTVGLDPIATQNFFLIVDQLRKNGCSIILCSHVLEGVEKHIDKAAILAHGKLRAYGSIEELREQAHLKTQIVFRGCFEIELLSQKLNHVINKNNDGSFTIDVSPQEKLAAIKMLVKQPGISNLDTRPPGLEKLYHFFVEKEHQVLNFPGTKPVKETTQVSVQP